MERGAYLCAIAVECLLKWTVCVRQGRMYPGEVDDGLVSARAHDLAWLLELSGLRFGPRDRRVQQDWARVERWTMGVRYMAQSVDEAAARRFRAACLRVCRWLESRAIAEAFARSDDGYELKVWDGTSGGVRVGVVAAAFERMDFDQRQDMVWKALRRVEDESLLEIMSLLTITPEEAREYVWLPQGSRTG